MFEFLRRSRKVLLIRDEAAFWEHCNVTQRHRDTPAGAAADAEERLDLRAGRTLKALLERVVGPEEGPDSVQMQNWDWHDDRCRTVYVLRRAFRPELIAQLQALLVGELADFEVIVVLQDTWQSEAWGHLKLSANQVAIQKNVVQAYAMAV